MKQQLKDLIETTILKWNEEDIYAISLFVYDDNDNPCKPTVTLSYNTEAQYENEREEAFNPEEARWNYAYWLQNEEFCFGLDDTAMYVQQWVEAQGFPYYEDEAVMDDFDLCDELHVITEAFAKVLVDIVKELHQSGVIRQKFGKEIPILIHELEYYDEIALQNIEANGEELVSDFVAFCREY